MPQCVPRTTKPVMARLPEMWTVYCQRQSTPSSILMRRRANSRIRKGYVKVRCFRETQRSGISFGACCGVLVPQLGEVPGGSWPAGRQVGESPTSLRETDPSLRIGKSVRKKKTAVNPCRKKAPKCYRGAGGVGDYKPGKGSTSRVLEKGATLKCFASTQRDSVGFVGESRIRDVPVFYRGGQKIRVGNPRPKSRPAINGLQQRREAGRSIRRKGGRRISNSDLKSRGVDDKI